jgi:hypothetical protein
MRSMLKSSVSWECREKASAGRSSASGAALGSGKADEPDRKSKIQGARTMTASSWRFFDKENEGEVFLGLRKAEARIGLTVSIENGADLEVFLPSEVALEVAKSLDEMARSSSVPGSSMREQQDRVRSEI